MWATNEIFEAFISGEKRGNLEYWQSKESINVYGNTKCAQICHAMKLQQIWNKETDSNGKTVGSYLYITSVQPGFINSGFIKIGSRNVVLRFLYVILYPFVGTFAMITPNQGAQTSLHCALSDENEGLKPGGYHGHCRNQNITKRAMPVIKAYMDSLYHASHKIWNHDQA